MYTITMKTEKLCAVVHALQQKFRIQAETLIINISSFLDSVYIECFQYDKFRIGLIETKRTRKKSLFKTFFEVFESQNTCTHLFNQA